MLWLELYLALVSSKYLVALHQIRHLYFIVCHKYKKIRRFKKIMENYTATSQDSFDTS